MIRISNANLQTEPKTFTGQIDIDASDGDEDSERLLALIIKLFDKARGGAIELPLR